MKKGSGILYILRLSLTLLLITSVVAGVLAGVNAITKDKIAAAQAEKTRKALEKVLPGVENLEKMELSGDTGMVKSVYVSGDSYAVEVAANGFNGEIAMMVGITGGKVTGISIISHSETPNLGAVAAADSAKGAAFRQQFTGLTGKIAIGDGSGAVDALSGATITSRAVVSGINAALAFVAGLD